LDGSAVEIINSLNGTPSGGVSFINDLERGDCAQFDGIDGIIDLPYPIWESATDTNTTITCWFNQTGGGGWQRIYSLGMTDGAWQCMYFSPKDGDGNLHITFKTLNPVDTWTDFAGVASFGDTYGVLDSMTWYFSAIVMEENNVRIYMNGEKVVDEEVFVTPQEIQPEISQNVLGKSHWADPTLYGMIDDFRIYGEALTDEQILAIYNGPNTGLEDLNNSFTLNFYGNDGRILYTSIDESKISFVSVYDLSGKMVFSSKRISDLKTRQFNQGIYLVSVISGNERITKKVALIR